MAVSQKLKSVMASANDKTVQTDSFEAILVSGVVNFLKCSVYWYLFSKVINSLKGENDNKNEKEDEH
jgi:hypothetical protein